MPEAVFCVQAAGLSAGGRADLQPNGKRAREEGTTVRVFPCTLWFCLLAVSGSYRARVCFLCSKISSISWPCGGSA